MKALRTLLWLAALAALILLALRMPIGGQTLWEQIFPPSEGPAMAPAAGKAQTGSADVDALTEEDRQGLDQLIDTKLKDRPKAGIDKPGVQTGGP